MSNIKTSCSNLTKDEILKSGGIIYDPSQNPINAPKDLPDSNQILDRVYNILEFISTDEIIKLKLENKPLYLQTVEDNFSDFSERYYALFNHIVNGKDITPLFGMLEQLHNIKSGKSTVEEVEKEVGKGLSKFIKHDKSKNKN